MTLRHELSAVSRELAAHGASFRLQPPKAPLAPGAPCRQLFSCDISWAHIAPPVPSHWLNDATDIGYQLKDSLKFTCDVAVTAHCPAFLQLFRVQWAARDYKWVDPPDQCNSEAEYDTDIQEDDAA